MSLFVQKRKYNSIQLWISLSNDYILCEDNYMTEKKKTETIECKYCKCNGPIGKNCYFCGKSFIF